MSHIRRLCGACAASYFGNNRGTAGLRVCALFCRLATLPAASSLVISLHGTYLEPGPLPPSSPPHLPLIKDFAGSREMGSEGVSAHCSALFPSFPFLASRLLLLRALSCAGAVGGGEAPPSLLSSFQWRCNLVLLTRLTCTQRERQKDADTCNCIHIAALKLNPSA